MNKLFLMPTIVGFSFLAIAENRYFKSSCGAWSDASNWYADKECTLPSDSIPASGDTATITLGSSAIISEGDWVEGITISIPGSTTDFASLSMDGGTITNCDINVGTENVIPENGKLALFTMDGGTIEGLIGGKRHGIAIESNGKFCQNGGLIHQYQATVSGWYNHVGGTNAVRGGAFYIKVQKSETSGYHISENAVISSWLAYNVNDSEMSPLSGNVFKDVSVLSDSNVGRIEVPNSNGLSVKLTISEVETKLPALWIASKRNGTTNTQTGIVEVVRGSKIHFTEFGCANNTTTFNNTNSYSAFIVKDSTVSNFVFSLNGTKADALSDHARFDIVLSNSVFCTSALDPEGDYSSYLEYENKDTTIGRGVALTVGEGSRYYAGAMLMNAGSKMTIDGGYLETSTILASDQNSDYAEIPHSIIVRNGGVLMSSVAHNSQIGNNSDLKCRYYIGSKNNKTTVNPSFFILDGGNFHKRDNTYGKIQLGYSGSQNVSRFEVRGKSSMRDVEEDSSDPKGFYVDVGESNCAEFIFKGGEHDINLSSLGDSTHRYLLEFIADKSPGSIAPVIFHRNNTSQDCGGDLRISLDGNVLLTTNSSFEIIKRTKGSLCTDFNSLPKDVGSTLWTVERGNSVAYATLAAELSFLADDASFVPESPVEMGSVSIKIGSTNRLVRVAFELSLKASDGTTPLGVEELESLAEELKNAGYAESCAEDGGLLVCFPLELAVPQATHRFAWDFTKTNGAKDLDNVTIKATVAAVRCAIEYDRKGLQFIIR